MKQIILLILYLLPTLVLSQDVDYEEMVRKIDSNLDSVLSKKCTVDRKQLCNTLKKFRDGNKVNLEHESGIYLGILYSGDRWFKQTYDYDKSFGLLYFKKNKAKIEVSFEVLITEEKSEVLQVLNYMASTKTNKKPKNNSLTSFLGRNSRSQVFAQCELVKNTYICSRNTKKDSLILIRSNSGNLYIYSLGLVRLNSASFDNVPGFHLAEIILTN